MRRYEARYRGGGRWEVRPRRRWISTPVRAGFTLAVGAGCVVEVWRRIGPYASPAEHILLVGGVTVTAALLWVLSRAGRP